jgi:hypothetical protein
MEKVLLRNLIRINPDNNSNKKPVVNGKAAKAPLVQKMKESSHDSNHEDETPSAKHAAKAERPD